MQLAGNKTIPVPDRTESGISFQEKGNGLLLSTFVAHRSLSVGRTPRGSTGHGQKTLGSCPSAKFLPLQSRGLLTRAELFAPSPSQCLPAALPKGPAGTGSLFVPPDPSRGRNALRQASCMCHRCAGKASTRVPSHRHCHSFHTMSLYLLSGRAARRLQNTIGAS